MIYPNSLRALLAGALLAVAAQAQTVNRSYDFGITFHDPSAGPYPSFSALGLGDTFQAAFSENYTSYVHQAGRDTLYGSDVVTSVYAGTVTAASAVIDGETFSGPLIWEVFVHNNINSGDLIGFGDLPSVVVDGFTISAMVNGPTPDATFTFLTLDVVTRSTTLFSDTSLGNFTGATFDQPGSGVQWRAALNLASYDASFVLVGNSQAMVIPEPSETGGLLAAAGLSLAAWRRRRA